MCARVAFKDQGRSSQNLSAPGTPFLVVPCSHPGTQAWAGRSNAEWDLRQSLDFKIFHLEFGDFIFNL